MQEQEVAIFTKINDNAFMSVAAEERKRGKVAADFWVDKASRVIFAG